MPDISLPVLFALVAAAPCLLFVYGALTFFLGSRLNRNFLWGFGFIWHFSSDLSFQETNRYYGVSLMLGAVLLAWMNLLIGLLLWASPGLFALCALLWLLFLPAVYVESVSSTRSFARRISLDSHILTTDALGSPIIPKPLRRTTFILPLVTMICVWVTAVFIILTASSAQNVLFTVPSLYGDSASDVTVWMISALGIALSLLICITTVVLTSASHMLRSSIDAERLQDMAYRQFTMMPAARSMLQRFAQPFTIGFSRLARLILFPFRIVSALLNFGTAINLERLSITRRMVLAAAVSELALASSLFTIGRSYAVAAALLFSFCGLLIWVMFTLIPRAQNCLSRPANRNKAIILAAILIAMAGTALSIWWRWHSAFQPPRISSLEITPTNQHLLEKGTTRFFVLSFDTQDRQVLPEPVTWTFSADHTIGRIDPDGTFRALMPGTGTLTATIGTIQATTPITIEMDTSKWLQLETEHAVILYRTPMQRQALYTQATIEALMEAVRTKMGTEYPVGKTRFILATDEFEFFNATQLSIYDALAVYYGDTIAVAPTTWNSGDPYDYDITEPINEAYTTMVLSHEYTHQMHDAALQDTLFSDFGIMPVNRDLWFVEGLADYVASGFDESAYDAIIEATERDRLLSLADMKGSTVWDRSEEEIALIYAEGYTFFAFLERTFGPDMLYPYFAALADGKDSDAAFLQAFGKSADALEPGWKAWLRTSARTIPYQTYESATSAI